ncbi:MAG: LysR family transcriptional regulator [Firmicutes bacterium]|nr:LysR family transcriptional regulator [Bacillota bacterium]
MKLRQLQIFTAAYREKSISGAARQLGISQPQVSVAIKALEQEYGLQLTRPEGRSVAFTEAGRELYRYAQPIVAMCEEMDAELKGLSGSGRLRVGSSISIGTCMLPSLVRKYSDQFPRVKVEVTVNSAELIEQAVLDRQLDFALIEGPVHDQRLAMEPYLDDELVLICGREHPLSREPVLTPEILQEQPLLLRERNSATRAMAEAALTAYGLAVTPAWESTSGTALVNAAAAGLGLAILPLRFAQPYIEQGLIVPLQLDGVEFHRTYNIIYRQDKYLSPAALDFLRLVDTEERTRFT